MQTDNRTIKERLADFLAYKNIGQDRFAQLANLSRGFANNVGDSIRQASLDKIKNAFPELNTLWLTSGVGTMLNDENAPIIHDETSEPFKTYLLPMSSIAFSFSSWISEFNRSIRSVSPVIEDFTPPELDISSM